MSDLQEDIDRWDRAKTFDEMVDMTLIVEAARRVANLDRNAAVSELTNWLVERLPITIDAPMVDMVVRCADAVLAAAVGITEDE